MATPGQLTTPPIAEAIVDLRVVPEIAVDRRRLEPLRHEFQRRYPRFEERRRNEIQIDARPGSVPQAESRDAGFHGLFLMDEHRSRVVQFRADGFTLSQLSGYTSADDLFEEALPLWTAYAGIVRPTASIRVALRYLNRLFLPLVAGDPFERFLTAPATMPAGVPQEVSEFLVRSVVHMNAPSPTTAIVTQRLEPGTGQGSPFVLDVDVFRIGEYDIDAESVRGALEELRRVKNDLFFGFVTDAALEPYR